MSNSEILWAVAHQAPLFMTHGAKTSKLGLTKGKGKPLPRLAVNHHKAAIMKGEWSLKWQEMGYEVFRFSLVCPRKQLPWPADVTVPVPLLGGSPRRCQVAPPQPWLWQLLPLLWLHVHPTFNGCTPGRGNSSPPVRSDPKSWSHPCFVFLSKPTSDSLANYLDSTFQAFPEPVCFSPPPLPSSPTILLPKPP